MEYIIRSLEKEDPEPIIENGIPCVDMLRLSKEVQQMIFGILVITCVAYFPITYSLIKRVRHLEEEVRELKQREDLV